MEDIEQLSLFDDILTEYKITKPVRLISFFSGIEAQFKALSFVGKKLNVQVSSYKTCEWAFNSIVGCNAIHNRDFNDYSFNVSRKDMIEHIRGISVDYNQPLTEEQLWKKPLPWIKKAYNNCIANHNLLNIMNVKGSDLEIVDTDKYEYILTYSFPCLVADTLVLTNNGYKKIIDIKVGDYVLTHNNQYQKVLAQKETGMHQTLVINAMPFDELILTYNHKVLTNNGWKQAKDLTKKDMLGIAINQNAIIPDYGGVDFVWADGRKARHSKKLDMSNPNFWWLIGRYIGDGWKRTQGGIVICCAKNELSEITSKIENIFNFSIVEERTVYKIHIPIKELGIFVDKFGKGASNKHLSKEIFDLPIDLLKSFLDGYFSADGCLYNGRLQCNSVSKQLIYDLGQCVAKVYKRPYSIYKNVPTPTKIIEGRKVNQKPWWQLRLLIAGKTRGWYDDNKGIIWCPINKITSGTIEKVYDIEVEKDHSFVANSVIVHNCQDLSLAGNRAGMSVSQAEGGTRSGLLWEVERILGELTEKPQILVMENVPAIHSEKDMPNFRKWIHRLEELGYTSFYEDLNGKDFGIPQNRERCFMVSILGKDLLYKFPRKIGRKYTLKDFLQNNVDEKYYLSQKMVDYLTGVNQKESKYDRGSVFERNLNPNKDIAAAVLTTAGQRATDNFILDDIKVVGNYMPSGHNAGRVVDPKGIAPAVMENHGTVTAVAIRENTLDGYREAHEGDGINISSRMKHQRGNVQNGMSQTLKTTCEVGTLEINGNAFRIRKLTEKEAGRLMGFQDIDTDRMKECGLGNTSLFHCYGDSIVVTVLIGIFLKLFGVGQNEVKQLINEYIETIKGE